MRQNLFGFCFNVKYIITNATSQDTVPSVTITSTPSPAQFSCTGSVTPNYYQLNPCCGGTTLIGFSANNSLSGSRLYNNQTYVISPTSSSGTIDIDSLPTSSCTIYYYTLNDCTNQSSIQHYGFSLCSNLLYYFESFGLLAFFKSFSWMLNLRG